MLTAATIGLGRVASRFFRMQCLDLLGRPTDARSQPQRQRKVAGLSSAAEFTLINLQSRGFSGKFSAAAPKVGSTFEGFALVRDRRR